LKHRRNIETPRFHKNIALKNYRLSLKSSIFANGLHFLFNRLSTYKDYKSFVWKCKHKTIKASNA